MEPTWQQLSEQAQQGLFVTAPIKMVMALQDSASMETTQYYRWKAATAPQATQPTSQHTGVNWEAL